MNKETGKNLISPDNLYPFCKMNEIEDDRFMSKIRPNREEQLLRKHD